MLAGLSSFQFPHKYLKWVPDNPVQDTQSSIFHLSAGRKLAFNAEFCFHQTRGFEYLKESLLLAKELNLFHVEKDTFSH